MNNKITISVIKADVGGFVGHSSIHKGLIEEAMEHKVIFFDTPEEICDLLVFNGHLEGPRDMFDDPGFDEARHLSNVLANHLHRQGPFEPHRLPMDEMEYTTLPLVMEKLSGRWEELSE